jgi:hypothetical protein
LIDAIGNGQIGLPDIQRPFVCKNVEVRELFDSMYRGYPVGYLLFWEAGQAGARKIGTDNKQLAPTRVIVDVACGRFCRPRNRATRYRAMVGPPVPGRNLPAQ